MIHLPAMSAEQTASWHALTELYERLSDHWVLVGGQMVHLHCAEHGHRPERPTDDVDTVVDVRAEPGMLLTFTAVLADLGFGPSTSRDGANRRHRRDFATLAGLVAARDLRTVDLRPEDRRRLRG